MHSIVLHSETPHSTRGLHLGGILNTEAIKGGPRVTPNALWKDVCLQFERGRLSATLFDLSWESSHHLSSSIFHHSAPVHKWWQKCQKHWLFEAKDLLYQIGWLANTPPMNREDQWSMTACSPAPGEVSVQVLQRVSTAMFRAALLLIAQAWK